MGKNQRPGLAGNQTYSPRRSRPSKSKYYWSSSPYKGSLNMFPNGNCTAYAWGRFWEVSEHFGGSTRLSASGNAEDWYYGSNSGFNRGSSPQLGAVICFKDGNFSGYGHVMVVEQIFSSNHILCSESGYKAYVFQTRHVYKKNGTWTIGNGYKFQGFIYNPNVPSNATNGTAVSDAGSSSGGSSGSYDSSGGGLSGTISVAAAQSVKANIKYKTVTTNVTTTKLKTYSGDLDRTKATSLLSYPSLVESPFVTVKLDNFTFGTYTTKKLSTSEKSKYRRQYPNYVKSLQVTKVNGTVNQYVITLVHQIEPGTDPNFVDKVLSRVGYGTIKITYGDYASPEFVYKEEEALITKVTSNVEFSASRITYVIYCTSSSLSLASNTYNWKARKAKPSDRIIAILRDNKYGLEDVFYGMKNLSKKVLRSTLIASDDKEVQIPAKKSMDPLSYINFLVTCMTATSNNNNNVAIKDSSYYMTIHDDVYGNENLNGPYFKITKVESSGKTLQTADTYEVDINYPSENLVTNFSIQNDNSWSLLYNYSDKMSPNRYVYSIGDDGIINTDETPNTLVSADKYKMVTETQKTWWTQMTQYPITATMTIKGLVRPAMLMTYIRVNAFFYGQRHIASGLYIITKQVDSIDQSGYRTTLSLQRVAGDNDYFITSTKKVTSKVVDSITYKTSGGSSGSSNTSDDKSLLDKIIDAFTWTADTMPESIKKKVENKKGLNGNNVETTMSYEEFKNSSKAAVTQLYGAKSSRTKKVYQKYLNNVEKYGAKGAITVTTVRAGSKTYQSKTSSHKK